MEISLTRCRLRPFRPGDEDALAESANDRDVWRNLRDRFPHPYTREDAVGWIAHTTANDASTSPRRADPLHVAIEVDGRVAGAIGIDIDEDVFRRSAEIGYWLAKRHWGKGIATEAVVAFTEHAFRRPEGLCRLYAGVFSWNPASARVLEKAGYVLEGRKRRAVFKDGEIIDELLYAFVR